VIDELDIRNKARQFMAGLDLSRIDTDLSVYIQKAKARLKTEEMGEGESGYTLTKRDGTSTIIVNELERRERQRFSACHEVGHIVLGLSSNHKETPSWSYAKREDNEISCDIFAAELLMPYDQFKADVDKAEPSFELVERLRAKYVTSFSATASRVAAVTDYPCAFVTMNSSVIRHASRSAALRTLNAWIAPKSPIPVGAVAHQLVKDGRSSGESSDISQDVWFQDWPRGYDLTELARHYPEYDETFALLWFDDDNGPEEPVNTFSGKPQEDDGGLKELDGILGFSGKRKRR
jgi:Zn-dependent peptidase ImmA (M78 family)